MTDKLKPGDFVEYNSKFGLKIGEVLSDANPNTDWDYLVKLFSWIHNKPWNMHFKRQELRKLEGAELARIKAVMLLNQ